MQCIIALGPHLSLARRQWSTNNLNFTWHPLKGMLSNEDFSRIDVAVGDNTDMFSHWGNDSVVVIEVDASWRGTVGGICVRHPNPSHRPVQHPSFVILSLRRSCPPFLLLYTTTTPLIPSSCFTPWDFWVFRTGRHSFTLHHDQGRWNWRVPPSHIMSTPTLLASYALCSLSLELMSSISVYWTLVSALYPDCDISTL